MGFYKRKADGKLSDTYTVDVRYRGTRIHRDTHCKTKREAEKWLASEKAEIDRGIAAGSVLSISSRMTLGEALAKYVEERLQFSRSWRATERYHVATLARRIGAEKQLVEISTADVSSYVSSRQKDKVAPATINRELTILRALWGHASEVWEMQLRPVAWKRVKLRIPDTEIIPPTVEQIKRLVQAADPELKQIIMFAVLTGLRLNEIRTLTWDRVNMDEGVALIDGKGGKRAWIPLSSHTISLLCSRQHDKGPQVFDTTNFRRRWEFTRKAAGLDSTRFHDLRHACATLLDNAGAPIQGIKQALRHGDISTSLRYAHAERSRMLPFLDKIGESLNDS